MRHPNTTLGAVAGFIFAVLVLTLGLWDTLVIAFFVLIGAVIGPNSRRRERDRQLLRPSV